MNFKIIALYVMAALYVLAGLNHFLHTSLYISIVPHLLPAKTLIVYISGVFEILLGVLLIPVKFRRVAAWGIIILLIAVFPANIQMVIDYYKTHNPYLWIAVVRLPLQFLLIGWAYVYTKQNIKQN